MNKLLNLKGSSTVALGKNKYYRCNKFNYSASEKPNRLYNKQYNELNNSQVDPSGKYTKSYIESKKLITNNTDILQTREKTNVKSKRNSLGYLYSNYSSKYPWRPIGNTKMSIGLHGYKRSYKNNSQCNSEKPIVKRLASTTTSDLENFSVNLMGNFICITLESFYSLLSFTIVVIAICLLLMAIVYLCGY